MLPEFLGIAVIEQPENPVLVGSIERGSDPANETVRYIALPTILQNRDPRVRIIANHLFGSEFSRSAMFAL